ncbi:uncharacterized protein MELLADRAFT_65965 [Melampsora larici-populina 98AG31]|uniref:Secreted protein n=1 Tax=Melampsora larici-populina (strain 98AG31 / pathotype 3-4-7) TaxID=747676 RepID=F4RXD7_MELLP|nr:uncharacterized protein MELLADRAFT_65965 [Melampsora larici-populina 98AG31]EGG03004.1 hypothetical protein MELLADRAFT_65965 [Melampsora larici-populina 98AG31]
MRSQLGTTFVRLALIVIISLARDPLLNFRFDGFVSAVEVTRSGTLNGPVDKCYVALKHNEPQSAPATAHNSTSVETIDDSNVISARLLTIDPFETSNRIVTLDNGKDCKIAVLLLVKEYKNRQNLKTFSSCQGEADTHLKESMQMRDFEEDHLQLRLLPVRLSIF